jgi:hypothetical protein
MHASFPLCPACFLQSWLQLRTLCSVVGLYPAVMCQHWTKGCYAADPMLLTLL